MSGQLRGFGMCFDIALGRCRNWYIDSQGAKRWTDSDELVAGSSGQRDRVRDDLDDQDDADLEDYLQTGDR